MTVQRKSHCLWVMHCILDVMFSLVSPVNNPGRKRSCPIPCSFFFIAALALALSIRTRSVMRLYLVIPAMDLNIQCLLQQCCHKGTPAAIFHSFFKTCNTDVLVARNRYIYWLSPLHGHHHQKSPSLFFFYVRLMMSCCEVFVFKMEDKLWLQSHSHVPKLTRMLRIIMPQCLRCFLWFKPDRGLCRQSDVLSMFTWSPEELHFPLTPKHMDTILD